MSAGTRASRMGLSRRKDVSHQEEAQQGLIGRTFKNRLGTGRNCMRKLPALERNQKVNLVTILIYSQRLTCSFVKRKLLFSTDLWFVGTTYFRD